MVLHDGSVLALPDFDSMMEALVEPELAREVRFAKLLT
jgi:hypothetical protein